MRKKRKNIIIKDLCFVDVFANKSREETKKNELHTQTHATNGDDQHKPRGQ